MPKFVYPEDVKAKIVEVAVAARKAKKGWAEAHAAAKDVGYKGSVQALVKLLRAESAKTGQPVGIKRRRGRKAGKKAVEVASAVAAAATPAKRGPGRPRKTAAPAATETGSLETMVAELVNARVRVALDKAIAMLEAVRA